MSIRRVLCVILDGVGYRKSMFGNAFALASTPCFDSLIQNNSNTLLNAHGTAVGLVSIGDMGNSEVGHNALGSGNVYDQGAKLVTNAIKDKSIFKTTVWKNICIKSKNSCLHLLGLLSDGNVHSHEEHLFALLREAKLSGINKVRLHLLLDGRDVEERSAEKYIANLNKVITELRDDNFDLQIASGGGRMTSTMDRYNADWSIVQRGWDAHVRGVSDNRFKSIEAAISSFRESEQNPSDQYLPDFVITDDKGEAVGQIHDNNVVVCFNFRGDRVIEISRAFCEENFTEFERSRFPKTYYVGMLSYDGDLDIPSNYLVKPPKIDFTLSKYLLSQNLRQFACSETQKFGHVTYFWNGNKSGYLDKSHEKYIEIESDSGIAFNLKPYMKAQEIADATIKEMTTNSFDFGRINFANGDMVGHTGDLQAAILSVSFMDNQLARILATAKSTNTTVIVTADHGNCDEMFMPSEKDYPNWSLEKATQFNIKPKTSHTLAPVPFVIYNSGVQHSLLAPKEGGLANVANTVLDLMGVSQSADFQRSLISKSK